MKRHKTHIAHFHVCKLRNEMPQYCTLCQNRIALGDKVHYGEGTYGDDDRSYCAPCYKLLLDQWVANNIARTVRREIKAKLQNRHTAWHEEHLAEQRNLNARVAGIRLRGRELLAADRERRRAEMAAFDQENIELIRKLIAEDPVIRRETMLLSLGESQ